MMNNELRGGVMNDGLGFRIHHSAFIIHHSGAPAFQTALDPPSVHVRGGLRPKA
jgi:hypothetical protein